MDMEQNIINVPIEDIIPNRFQPRLTFNEEGLNELSDSIKQHGIIQPIVVRRLGNKYEIIAGERRYKAATMAGLSVVPVVISNIDDNKSAEVALVENIQRRNLTSIEEARSYKNLLDRGYLTQEQLAKKMGVSQSTIANKLRLLNLDPEVQDALLNEKISERHARALLSLDTKEEQRDWLKRIINERMTVRQLDTELKKYKNPDSDEDSAIPLVNINPDLDKILNNAEDINIARKPHDVASMLTPDENIEITPKVEEKIPIVPENTPKDNPMPNKFFNFLEDEEANMSMGEEDEGESIFSMNTPNILEPLKEPVEEEPSEEKVIPQEEPPKETSNDNDLDIFSSSPIIENDPLTKETDNEPLEPENIEEVVVEDSPKQSTPEIETLDDEEEDLFSKEDFSDILAEAEEENKKEGLIDPVDRIITLDENYEENKKEEEGLDLKSAINNVRNVINDLNNKGFSIGIEEADLDNIYQITINIDK